MLKRVAEGEKIIWWKSGRIVGRKACRRRGVKASKPNPCQLQFIPRLSRRRLVLYFSVRKFIRVIIFIFPYKELHVWILGLWSLFQLSYRVSVQIWWIWLSCLFVHNLFRIIGLSTWFINCRIDFSSRAFWTTLLIVSILGQIRVIEFGSMSFAAHLNYQLAFAMCPPRGNHLCPFIFSFARILGFKNRLSVNYSFCYDLFLLISS